MMEWMLMPFRRYAEFTGRSRRKEFWMWSLFLFLVYLAFMIVMFTLGISAFMGAGMGSGGATAAFGGGLLLVIGLLSLFGLAVLVPNIAVAVRRLHDVNRSGWFVLLPLAGYPVLIVGSAAHSAILYGLGALVVLGLAITVLVWYCTDGTPGPNRYGPDPKLRGEGGVGLGKDAYTGSVSY